MTGFEYTVGEMNVMPTVAYLNEISLGWGEVFVSAGIAHGFRTDLVVIEGSLNAQRYRDEILATHVIYCFEIMPLSLFFSMIVPQAIRLGTLRAYNIAFINDLPDKSPDLNPIEQLWDNFVHCVRRRPIPPSNVMKLIQALTLSQTSPGFYVSAVQAS